MRGSNARIWRSNSSATRKPPSAVSEHTKKKGRFHTLEPAPVLQLELHAERKVNLRWSAFRGIPVLIEIGGHESGRGALGHGGVHRAPVVPFERVVVVESELRLEALLDREVLVHRRVGADDPLLDPEVPGQVAAGERRSYGLAQVALGRSIRVVEIGRASC